MQARAVFFFSACISRFDEKKNQGGSISCGQPGSFYCGFSIIGAGVVLILFIVWFLLSTTNLSRRPKYAKMFLEDSAINVNLPKFKVLDHTLQFTGGDDTEIRWEVKFKKPLSDEFVETLDSLCHSYGSGWHFDRQNHRYIYTYWHPNDIEITDCVSISPENQSATFQHIKI